MITEQDGENAFKLFQELKSNEEQRRKLFSNNVSILALLKDKDLYKAYLGDDKAPWSALLAQIEVYYSQNEVYTYLRIHDYFTKEKGINLAMLSDIPKSRLYDIAVLKPINADDWLHNARQLVSTDWVRELRAAKNLPVDDDGHKHEFEPFEACKKCGLKVKHDHAVEK